MAAVETHEPALVAIRENVYYRDFDLTALLVRQLRGRAEQFVLAIPTRRRAYKDGPQQLEPLHCAEIMLRQAGRSPRRGAPPRSGHVLHIYAGEDFDARRQQASWDRAGFDDRAWQLCAARARQQLDTSFPGHPSGSTRRFRTVTGRVPLQFSKTWPRVAVELRRQAGASFRCGDTRTTRTAGRYIVGCDVVTDGRPLMGSFYLGITVRRGDGAVPKDKPTRKISPSFAGWNWWRRAGLPQARSVRTLQPRTTYRRHARP